MDSTLNLLRGNEMKMQKHMSAFNDLVNTINNQSNVLEMEANVHNLMMYLTQIIDDYEKQQSSIIDAITFSRRDHISHELFTSEQINEQVELIKKQVGPEFRVPSGIDVYSVSKISLTRLHDQFIFKLSIPLLVARRFKLFKIIAVPTVRNGKLYALENEHKFLLTSIDRQQFQYLNKYDCKPYQNKKALICNKPNKFYTATCSDCVWNVFNYISKNHCVMKKSKVSTRMNFFLYYQKKRR